MATLPINVSIIFFYLIFLFVGVFVVHFVPFKR